MLTTSLRRLMMILMLSLTAVAFVGACGDLDEEGDCDPELDGDDCVCEDEEDLSTCFFEDEELVLDVAIEGSGFSPKNLTIQAGDTVTWTNNDANDHTVTCQNCPNGVTFPDDDLLTTGASFQFTFDVSGNYTIVDRLNDDAAFESTITVE